MAFYEFVGENCPLAAKGKCKLVKRGTSCLQIMQFPMSGPPQLGVPYGCPHCKGGRLTRIFSLPNVIVRGSSLVDYVPGETLRTQVNGQEVRLSFIDHPHTDPNAARRLRRVADRSGVSQKGAGIGKAYYSEKHGRLCVDVASNIPDPLGVMERAKQTGQMVTEKVHVGQPFKVRQPRRGRR